MCNVKSHHEYSLRIQGMFSKGKATGYGIIIKLNTCM